MRQAIAISFQVSVISEEIHIAVAIHTTVKTYGRDFTLNIKYLYMSQLQMLHVRVRS